MYAYFQKPVLAFVDDLNPNYRVRSIHS